MSHKVRLMILLVVVMLTGGLVISNDVTRASPATAWTLSGRVYEGSVGEVSRPLANVTVALYGANDPYPAGTLLRTTTTDATGWYGLTVYDDDLGLYEYVYLLEQDPDGYLSVGATTVDGIAASANRIEYVPPLEDKILTGNKFWDAIPLLSGRVYQGNVGDEGSPMAGATLELYGSNNVGVLGTFVMSTTTDAAGWYGLAAPVGFESYTIREVDPDGFDSVGATTVDGAVQDANHILYTHPLEGKIWTGNKFWDVPTGGLNPDLVITGIWEEGGHICYTLMNVGLSPAPAGHDVALEVDDALIETRPVAVELTLDQQIAACFDALWSCSPGEDAVAVTADANNEVTETNENNTLLEVWQCDTTPPVITSGPTVANVSTNAVDVTWTTDEPASSSVVYGQPARTFTGEKHDSTLVTNHTLHLTDLETGTTYRYRAYSFDGSGNLVESAVHTFETAAADDTTDPTVNLIDPGLVRGAVVITATASDDGLLERVVFYLNGDPVFTDYTAPFELPLDSELYANGKYTVKAVAYDQRGNWSDATREIDIGNLVDSSVPTVVITAPADNAVLSGKVNVIALLTDDQGLAQVFFKISQGTQVTTWGFEGLPAHPTSHTTSFEWDTTQVTNGAYRVAIEVFDTDGKVGYDFKDIHVNQGAQTLPAKLKVVRHTATRIQHGFVVNLVVKNVGGETASNVALEDTLYGFQPISRTSTLPTYATYAVDYDPYHQSAEVQITAHAPIAPGETVTYTYHGAPILFYPTGPAISIGDTIGVHWDRPTGAREHDIVALPIATVQDGDLLATAHAKAVKAADYVLMTNPTRLYAYGYPDVDQVPIVLSEMAQLAIYQQGALGYLNTYNRGDIDKLLEPQGAWAKALAPAFSQTLGGYVLIVGEREIVPTWFWTGFSLKWSNSTCVTQQIQDSDAGYADTSGSQAPELIVGRIIGNDPQDLANVIRTSNRVYEGRAGYGFDRSHALLVSGTDATASIQNKFMTFVTDTAKILSPGVNVTSVHWSSTSVWAQRLNWFTSNTPDQDIICYQGHGSPDGWGDFHTQDAAGWGQTTPQIPALDFGNTNPVMVGLACLTGSYENNVGKSCAYNGGDYNIAETFLDAGAGVYIGATEVSAINRNVAAGKELFQSRWTPSTTIGQALTEVKRNHWSSSDAYWRFWVLEYNLYGDPKYGVVPPTAQATAAPQAAAPQAAAPQSAVPTTLNITLPDYTVTTVDGVDYVEIPGGGLTMTAGQPQIPIYVVTEDYPAGTRVQDVTLTARTGLQTATGFDLPVHQDLFAVGDPALPATRAAALSATAAWQPGKTYEWELWENPDGSTTLVVTLYPFSYNAATSEARYYTDYTLDVDYVASDVRIEALTLDRAVYDYDQTLNAALSISATGSSDVAVGGVIRRVSTGEVRVELLMETLSSLGGAASFTPDWTVDDVEPGAYELEVTVQRPDGTLLDRRTRPFQVGTVTGVITELMVMPAHFNPGEVVTATLGFHNTGTTAVDGAWSVEVRDAAGRTVATLGDMFTDLGSDVATTFEAAWQTPAAASGAYYLVGSVIYEGYAAGPEYAMAQARSWLYLPLVVRNLSP